MRTRGALDVLEGRRNVTNFTGEPVSRDVVDRLIKAGLTAHSMKGKRPCDVLVTQERKLLDALGTALGTEETEVIRNASAVLVVVGSPGKGAGGQTGPWAQDCAAATQALLYSASAQGVGALWMGVYPDEELAKKVSAALELPDFAVPVSVVPVGVPLKQDEAREGIDMGKIHWNLW